ncbi:hypothetical protein [Nocardioides limicola]|nr:hypothetical protein [Nocardioides sp. DJM-14]
MIKKLLVLAVVGSVAALLFKKLRSGEDDGWQTAYTPPPAPVPDAG